MSVIPIYGVHFDVYAKLFSENALPKRCAIVCDGDLKPSDADVDLEGDDDLPDVPDLKALESDYVKVFACATTFERALTAEGTLAMFARAAEDIGAPIVAERLRDGLAVLEDEDTDDNDRKETLTSVRNAVLSTAKRFGKARFAQLAARYAAEATGLPKYITDAAEWLTEA